MPQNNTAATVDFSQIRYAAFEMFTYDENKKDAAAYGRTKAVHKKVKGRVARQVGDERGSYREEDKRAQCTRRNVDSLYRGCSVVPLDVLAYFNALCCGLEFPAGFSAEYANRQSDLNKNRQTDMLALKRLLRMDDLLIFPTLTFSSLCGGDAGLKRRMLDALDHFSAVRPAGSVARQLLFSLTGNAPSCFTYIHDFPIQNMDDIILLPLLEAIRKKCPVRFQQSSYTMQGIKGPVEVYPLFILDKADLSGRRHLFAYPVPEQEEPFEEIKTKLTAIRLDYINSVELCPEKGMPGLYDEAENAAKEVLPCIFNAGYKARGPVYNPLTINAAFSSDDGVWQSLKDELHLHLGKDSIAFEEDKKTCRIKVYEANEMMPFFLSRIGYVADLKGPAHIGERFAAHVKDLETLYARERREGELMQDIPSPGAMTDSYRYAFDQPNEKNNRKPPSREAFELKKNRLYNPYMSPFIPLYLLYLRTPSLKTKEIAAWLDGEHISGFNGMLYPDGVLPCLMGTEDNSVHRLAEDLRGLDESHQISALGERPMTYDELCFVYDMLKDKKAELFLDGEEGGEIKRILRALAPYHDLYRLLDTLGGEQKAFFEALKTVCGQEKALNGSLRTLNGVLGVLTTAGIQTVMDELEALRGANKPLESDAVCQILHAYRGQFPAERDARLLEDYDPIRLIQARRGLIDGMMEQCKSIKEGRQEAAKAFAERFTVPEACRTAEERLKNLPDELDNVRMDDEPKRDALKAWLKDTIRALCGHAVPEKIDDPEAYARALARWADELNAEMRAKIRECPLTASSHKSRLKTWIWKNYGVDPRAVLHAGGGFVSQLRPFDPEKIAVPNLETEQTFLALSRALHARMSGPDRTVYLDGNKLGETGLSDVFRTLLTVIHESGCVRITMKTGEQNGEKSEEQKTVQKTVQPLALEYDRQEGRFALLAGLGQKDFGVFPLYSITKAEPVSETLTPVQTLVDYHRQERVFLRVASARGGIERVLMALNAYDKQALHVSYATNEKEGRRYPFAIVAVDFAEADKQRLIDTLFAFGSTVEVLDVDAGKYSNCGADIRKEMLERIRRQAELIEANAGWCARYEASGWLKTGGRVPLPDALKFTSENSLTYWMENTVGAAASGDGE